MPLSYYAARANLYYLWQQHPDWSHAELAGALDCSVSWVEKWLNRIRCELAAGELLEHILQGHSRARKTAPPTTQPLVVEQILAFREKVGPFGTLYYPCHDWVDPKLAKRSMELMVEQVMPKVNAALKD